MLQTDAIVNVVMDPANESMIFYLAMDLDTLPVNPY